MQQTGTTSTAPWSDIELKDLVEFLCDKMWWRVQCEHERKREKKLCADRERCPAGNPESVHYSDILRLQIDQCQKTRKKYSDRMSIAEDKFMTGITQLMERHAPRSLTSSAATISRVEGETLGAKLESLRQTVDASVKQRKQDQEENNKLSASASAKISATAAAQAKLSKETDELKKSLELERQRNDRLEKRLEDMERKLNSMSQKQDKLAQETASNTLPGNECSVKMTQVLERLDSISVSAVTRGELKMALEQFDDVITSPVDTSYIGRQDDEPGPSGNKTRQYLRQLSRVVEDVKSSIGYDADGAVPRCIADLQEKVSSCTKSIQSHYEQSLIMSETLKTLQESICSLQSEAQQKQEHDLPPPPPTTTTTSSSSSSLPHTLPLRPLPSLSAGHGVNQQDLDTQMMRLSASLTEDIQRKMQEKLAKVAEQLGSFIDKERREREQASSKAEDSCNKVESLSQSVDDLKNHMQNSVHKLDSLCVHILTQLEHHKDGMGSFDSRLQFVAMEHARHAEEVAMQLRVVNTWQSNFTTKPLYLDIVAHINRTLPSGIHAKMSMLASRVEAVESQLRADEAAALKKRKVQQ
ncbi:hypothetical protein E4U54_005919 [Claviceps lovelessii]|nr:hypothetical protein E4U54_005919 [Claviceps lovelessii]